MRNTEHRRAQALLGAVVPALRPAAGLIVFGSLLLAADPRAQTPERDARDARARVQALSSRLRYQDDDPADRRRYDAERQRITERLRREVDRYVQAAVTPWENVDRTESRLRALLADHEPHPEVGGPPSARSGDLREGRALLVTYLLVRPPHHDVATIRGYRANGQRLALVATAGEDFEGYGLFTRQIASQAPGEIWLLAWGRSHTFNGTLVRFRLYAFDGRRIKTIWSPDDMLDARVSFDTAGFAIDDDIRTPPFERRTEYTLIPQGPVGVEVAPRVRPR